MTHSQHCLHLLQAATVALSAALCSWPASAAQRTFPGNAPCDTTLQACIDNAQPYDVIELAFSSANAEDLEIGKSLTLQPASGYSPRIASAAVYASGGQTNLEVVLRGLTITGGLTGLHLPGTGMLQLDVVGNQFPNAGTTPAIEVRTHTSAGVYGSLNVQMQSNRITAAGNSSSCADAIAVALNQPSEGVPQITLRQNDITATSLLQCAAVSVYLGSAAQGIDFTAERNHVQGSNFANGLLLRPNGGLVRASLYGNLVHGQSGNAGAPGAIVLLAGGSSSTTAQIVNNTVANNQTGILVTARTDEGASLQGSMHNNIIAFHSQSGLAYPGSLAPGFLESHNLLYGNPAPQQPLPADPYRRTADPAFLNAAAGDYRLSASSDAINRGLTSALPASITQDLANAARIVGGAIDLGAYEYQQAAPPPPGPPAGAHVTAVPTLGQWALLLLAALLGWASLRRLPGPP